MIMDLRQVADLRQEELLLAAELRNIVHNRQNTGHEEEAEVLIRLGEVYSRLAAAERDFSRHDSTASDFGHYTKASALLNAASRRTKEEDRLALIENKLHSIWSAILTDMNVAMTTSKATWQTWRVENKECLTRIRQSLQQECHLLEQIWSRYGSEENRTIEKKIITFTQHLGKQVSEEMKALINRLLDHCHHLLGEVPCRYAVIGLGSLARDESTPYSDLEFAILVEDLPTNKLETAKCYFRHLTYLLHLQILDFGETILPTMAIPSLNDFYHILEGQDWFYDDVTPSGFKFDSDMPWASKTPYGIKQVGDNMRKSSIELICTPFEMAKYLSDDSSKKQGYHLAEILSTSTLIAGSEDVMHEFNGHSKVIVQEQCQGNRGIHILRSVLWTSGSVSFEDMLKVKHDMYRLPSLLVNSLRMVYDIDSATPWEVIETMQTKKILTPEAGHNLGLLVSITCGLRMLTYMTLGRQKENVSFLPTTKGEKQESELAYRLDNQTILESYFSLIIPTQQILVEEYLIKKRDTPADIMEADFRMYSDYVAGLVHFIRGEYEKSISCQVAVMPPFQIFVQSGAEKRQPIKMLDYREAERLFQPEQVALLGATYEKAGKHKMALQLYETFLALEREVHSDDVNNERVIFAIHQVGTSLSIQNQYDTALRHFEEEVNMIRHLPPGGDSDGSLLSKAFLAIASVYQRSGQYASALGYCKQCLEIAETLPNTHTLAAALFKLASLYSEMYQYLITLDTVNRLVQLLRDLYGTTTSHPNMARALIVKANASIWLNDLEKAEDLFSWSLNMLVQNHDSVENAGSVAICYRGLGHIRLKRNEHRQAFEAYERARDLWIESHGSTAHFILASIVTGIGNAKVGQGDPQSALLDFEQAFALIKRLFSSEMHPYQIESLHGWGKALVKLADYKSAAEKFHHCLKIHSVTFQDIPNALLAIVLSDLGLAYYEARKPQLAAKYLEELLSWKDVNYCGLSSPDVATSMLILAKCLRQLGDKHRALIQLEEAKCVFNTQCGYDDSDPKMRFIFRDLALVHCDLLHYGQAIELGETQLRLTAAYADSGTSSSSTSSSEEIATGHTTTGIIYQRCNKHDIALEHFRKALTALDGVKVSEPRAEIKFKILVNLTTSSDAIGQNDKAHAYFKLALQILTSHPMNDKINAEFAKTVRLKLGTISKYSEQILGKLKSAASRTEAAALKPTFHEISRVAFLYIDQAECLMSTGLYQSGNYFDVAELLSLVAQLLYRLGLCYQTLGDATESTKCFDLALKFGMKHHAVGSYDLHPTTEPLWRARDELAKWFSMVVKQI